MTEEEKPQESIEKEQEEVKEQPAQDIFQNKILWIVGIIVLFIAGWLGLKVMFAPFDNYKVTLVDAPKEVAVGGTATFTWRFDGSPTTINQTVIHLGTVSNPGELDKEVKPADTVYTDFVKDFASGEFNIPLQFIGNIKMDKKGKYYFRVYTTIKDKHYWSDEYSFEVK